MVSTVTTSTITTAALVSSAALVGFLVLISLLVQRELSAAGTNERLQKWNQGLKLAIAPLLLAFLLTFVVKVLQAVR